LSDLSGQVFGQIFGAMKERGEEMRDGLRTYKFQAITPLEKIGSMELPGALFGVAKPSVKADTEYADTQTFWIEPATGSVVDLHEVLRQQFSYGAAWSRQSRRPWRALPPTADLMTKTWQGALVLPCMRGRGSLVLVVLGLALLTWWAHCALRGWPESRSMSRSAGGRRRGSRRRRTRPSTARSPAPTASSPRPARRPARAGPGRRPGPPARSRRTR
jgi:hypothetical protein